MSVLGNPLLITPEGYQISRSVRLRSSASAYFNRTPASAGNLSTWTFSAWVKRGILSSGYEVLMMGGTDTTNNTLGISFTPSDTLQIQGYSTTYFTSSQVFRDPSAWYHIVVAFDSTQATQANRIKVYVNGAQIAAATNALPLNGTWNINNSVFQAIGTQSATWGFVPFDGYMTEINFVNAQQLTASSFGEADAVTGVWKPKKYAGTYGTNGYYLNFSDNSAATAATIGKDSSGNGNNWTPNNISVTAGVTYDSMLDVPTLYADGGNGRGNYCTLNPLTGSTQTLSDGNLLASKSASTTNYLTAGTFGVSSGKWYWEGAYTSGAGMVFGVTQDPMGRNNFFSLSSGALDYTYYSFNGIKSNAGTDTAYGASFTTGDIIGLALDLNTGTLTFYKNGISQGTAFSSLSGTFFPLWSNSSGGAASATFNFGQRPFAYTPPTGFKALNTQNLPDATIKAGNKFFDASLYTGNGDISQTRVIANGNFQPDLVWVKNRNAANGHALQDSSRGAGGILRTELTAAELTGRTDILNGFSSTGFVVGGDTLTNANANTYVGWQWKKGATQGFDIVTYTGVGGSASFNHSLGVKPSFIIVKCRSTGGNSADVYHKDLGATKGIYLDLTNAAATSSVFWNNTEPTSTQFTVGATNNANGTGLTYVAWLWAEVAGFSKFGSYTGNGSADGPFVYLGFKPKFIMVKRTDAVENWYTFDNARDTYNQAGNYPLLPNSSVAEPASGATYSVYLDVLSNGFKLRTTSAGDNASGGTYIFAAFAENPFKNSLAR